mgnify:CR=1 FL=1
MSKVYAVIEVTKEPYKWGNTHLVVICETREDAEKYISEMKFDDYGDDDVYSDVEPESGSVRTVKWESIYDGESQEVCRYLYFIKEKEVWKAKGE